MTKLITQADIAGRSLEELRGLYRLMFNQLAQSHAETPERCNALASLETIQQALHARIAKGPS